MATSRPANAFISVDLPTLGGPAITTVKPSRKRSPGVRGRERPVDPLDCGPRRPPDRVAATSLRGILDVGEIDLSFNSRHRLEKAGADRLAFAAQRAAGDALSLAPLRLRLRLDEVGEAFDLREIDLSVDERAPREFSRLGEAQSGNEVQRLDNRRR